jgi:hypothetical protein
MACELELARKVADAARDHGRWCSIKLSCRLCAALREYDAGETSAEFQPIDAAGHPEPRKPSFAEAAGNIIRVGYASRAVGVTWAGILDVIERARRASGEL